MHGWQTGHDDKTGGNRHKVSPGFGHALLSPMLAQVFEALHVSASVWEHGMDWMLLHAEPNISSFEYAHGLGAERTAHNGRNLDEAMRRKRAVVGRHAGYCDLFVPILYERKVVGVLVTGPFATAPATSAGIHQQWRSMTGRQGHLEDPAFAGYVSATLSTLVLDGPKHAVFRKLVGLLTKLMVGEGRADALVNRAEPLRIELEGTRVAERTWETVRTMIDERSSLETQGPIFSAGLKRLGLSRTADDVLVGLVRGRGTSVDPVDEVIRRNALQRAVVHLARGIGDVLCGQVGDHGMVFVSAKQGTRQARRRGLLALADKTGRLAQRDFGLTLHFGASLGSGPIPIPRVYQAALAAAESALIKGDRMSFADPAAVAPIPSLGNLRRDLGRAIGEPADRLPARFDRYLEAVAAQCGYRTESARGHLEAGFERVAEPLVHRGMLDERSFEALATALDRAAAGAQTVSDLFAAYRRAVADLVAAVQSPLPARQGRALQRAVDHIQQHYAEPLRSDGVARIAGFARSYFSKLFRQREKMTFEAYLKKLRLERAKQLLAGTDVGVSRVAELSGFGSSQYFARVFRQATGRTPTEYRARLS
jgi:AraC-like DNA-binding protein